MTEQEKRAHYAPQQDHGKVSDNLAIDQSFQHENADEPQPDFSLTDNPEIPTDDTANEVMELPIWGLPEPLQKVVVEVTKGYRSYRDFVIASLMSATACIVGKRVTVHHDNYTNHANFSK